MTTAALATDVGPPRTRVPALRAGSLEPLCNDNEGLSETDSPSLPIDTLSGPS